MVSQVISNCFSLGEINNFLNNQTQFQDAVNLASLQLYLQHRDDFGINQEATDYLQEFYDVYAGTIDTPNNNVEIDPSVSPAIIDVVKVIEVQYVADGPWYAVKLFSPNEWNLAITNPVTPPAIRRQGVYGQLVTAWTYNVLPAGYIAVRMRCLVQPLRAEFTLTPSDGLVPNINVTQDWQWTDEKDFKLTYYTLVNLGVPISSEMLMKMGITQAATTP